MNASHTARRLLLVVAVAGLAVVPAAASAQGNSKATRAKAKTGTGASGAVGQAGGQVGAGQQGAANPSQLPGAGGVVFPNKLTKQFDANGNGRLDPDEVQSMQAALAQLKAGGPQLAKAKALKQFDTDGDGRLSSAERKAAQAMIAKGLPGAPTSPGAVSPPGLGLPGGAGAGAPPAGVNPLLSKFDGNGDGQLSAQERQEMHKAMQQRRGGAGFKPTK